MLLVGRDSVNGTRAGRRARRCALVLDGPAVRPYRNSLASVIH